MLIIHLRTAYHSWRLIGLVYYRWRDKLPQKDPPLGCPYDGCMPASTTVTPAELITKECT